MNVAQGALRERLGIEDPQGQKAKGARHRDDEPHSCRRGHGLMGRTPTHHHGHHEGRAPTNAQERGESPQGRREQG